MTTTDWTAFNKFSEASTIMGQMLWATWEEIVGIDKWIVAPQQMESLWAQTNESIYTWKTLGHLVYVANDNCKWRISLIDCTFLDVNQWPQISSFS